MHYVILHIVLRHIPSYTLSAGVAQGDILRFAWQAWHLWHWVARLGWFWSPVTPRHFAAALCVAGVAQSHIHLRFAWQAWHVWHCVAHLGWFWSPVTPRHFEWQAWHLVTSTLVSRGRRGTYGTGWRAWAGFGRPWRRGTLPRHFTAALCVAGVAQSHIHLRFAWQAWHVWHWVAHLGWFWSPVTPRHFEWQARHKVTSTFVSRGRRGTWSHPRWFHVAGVALMALGGALGLVLVARDAAALCVAGVALGHILHNSYNYIHIYIHTHIYIYYTIDIYIYIYIYIIIYKYIIR